LEADILAITEDSITIVIIQYALLMSGNESRDCYHSISQSKPQRTSNSGDKQGINCNSAIVMKKKNSNIKYFPNTNEYLVEARGRRATSSKRYSNTCRRQRRGRREG
jgi:hypothetical protein